MEKSYWRSLLGPPMDSQILEGDMREASIGPPPDVVDVPALVVLDGGAQVNVVSVGVVDGAGVDVLGEEVGDML